MDFQPQTTDRYFGGQYLQRVKETGGVKRNTQREICYFLASDSKLFVVASEAVRLLRRTTGQIVTQVYLLGRAKKLMGMSGVGKKIDFQDSQLGWYRLEHNPTSWLPIRTIPAI
ncbi:uncharacterized protein LOC132315969 isoform X5 [Cornus florida]|uniref:uncharacterized protein LOC132315969 isoform X5 n=1 Tax=Cornus florida TaxID=4283 RepID=UPI0028A2A236|nr:uncharacterized protein LOC132315969 isoform X5 [Cornus florida]